MKGRRFKGFYSGCRAMRKGLYAMLFSKAIKKYSHVKCQSSEKRQKSGKKAAC
jgi:hypothetical protein